MANERSYGARKGWTPEEEEWARISRNRDLGQPFDYDEAVRACKTPEGVCYDYEGGGQERGREEAARPRDREYYAGRPVLSGSGQTVEDWSIPGRYAGQGPKGYKRSDERIKEEVCDRLMLHGYIDAEEIEVDVRNGVVVLTGTVGDREAKHAAEDTAASVFGVTDVQNQLRIVEYDETLTGAAEMRRGSLGGEKGDLRLGRERISEGMEVVGSDGEYIGEVKEIRERDFLVNRSMARDIYVPFSAVAKSDRHVILNVSADQVNDMNWERPPLLGGEKSKNIWPA